MNRFYDYGQCGKSNAINHILSMPILGLLLGIPYLELGTIFRIPPSCLDTGMVKTSGFATPGGITNELLPIQPAFSQWLVGFTQPWIFPVMSQLMGLILGHSHQNNTNCILKGYDLVGGWATSLKNMSSPVGIVKFPTEWEKTMF